MNTLSAYYSGDIAAARAAHRAHVRHGDLRRRRPVAARRVRRVERTAYGHYDGDLQALLVSLR